MLTLACIAGYQWELVIADVAAAFLQSPELPRPNGPVYVRLPKQLYSASQIGKLLRPVYGLDDAPMHWYRYCRDTALSL